MKTKHILSTILIILSLNSYGQKKKSELKFDQNLYSSIEYRLVGPFRGGRAGTAVGVLNNPNLLSKNINKNG